jgi:hypothetical protein
VLPRRDERAADTGALSGPDPEQIIAGREPLLDLLHLRAPEAESVRADVARRLAAVRDPAAIRALMLRGAGWLQMMVARHAPLELMGEEVRLQIDARPELLDIFLQRNDLDPLARGRADQAALMQLHRLRRAKEPAELERLQEVARVIDRLSGPDADAWPRTGAFIEDLVDIARTPHLTLVERSFRRYQVEPTAAARVAFGVLSRVRGLTAEQLLSLFSTFPDERDWALALVAHPDATPEVWAAIGTTTSDQNVRSAILRIPAARTQEPSRSVLLEHWQEDVIVEMFAEYSAEQMPRRLDHVLLYNSSAALDLIEKHADRCQGILTPDRVLSLMQHRDGKVRLRAIAVLAQVPGLLTPEASVVADSPLEPEDPVQGALPGQMGAAEVGAVPPAAVQPAAAQASASVRR